jgi:hypothetical protein
MFHSTESRPLTPILAVPALTLLLAGGAAICSGTYRTSAWLESTVAPCPGGVLEVCLAADGSLAPAEDASRHSQGLEISPVAGIDISFAPGEAAVPAEQAPVTSPATLAVGSAGVMDVSFTPATDR